MAPEKENPAKYTGIEDHPVDMFGGGIILFNMVFGLMPFRRATKFDVDYRHIC